MSDLADLSSFIKEEWSKPEVVRYNTRDLLLYAVGIGCGQAGPKYYNDMRFVYEQDPNFAAFPTFPVSLAMKGKGFDADSNASSDIYLGKVKTDEGPFKQPEPGEPKMPIKGVKVGVDYERFMVKLKDMPTKDTTLYRRSRLYGVTQKKSGAVVETEEELYGEDGTVYYKFIGAGFQIGGNGFKDAGKTNAVDMRPPDRAPDAVDELKVHNTAHLIYRLCGDYNPLHIDPDSPSVKGGNFPEPILMGLCTLGHVSRSVLNACAGGDPNRFKALKLRFQSPVLPGQTLVTSVWKVDGGVYGDRYLFNTKVKETDRVCISNSYMELSGAGSKL